MSEELIDRLRQATARAARMPEDVEGVTCPTALGARGSWSGDACAERHRGARFVHRCSRSAGHATRHRCNCMHDWKPGA